MLRFLAVAVGAGALMVGGLSPAQAANGGGGTVAGQVTSSPGVPILPGVTNTSQVHFASTVILGTIVVNNCAAAGPVNVTASATATDTNATGTGTVNTLSGSGSAGPTTINVNGGGTFTRVGTNVTVVLTLNATVSGTCNTSGVITVTVNAEFIPTSVDAVNQTVNGALFTGGFVVQ